MKTKLNLQSLLRRLVICLSILAVLPVAAQDPGDKTGDKTTAQTPQLRRDAQAINLIQACLTAMAGSVPFDSTAQGTIRFADERTGTVSFEVKGLDKLKSQLVADGHEYVAVISGGRGYALTDGKRRDLPVWVTQYNRPDYLPILSRLTDLNKANANLVYVGLEEVNGKQAHHIRLSALPTDETPATAEELLSEFHVFIDPQTHVLVKTTSFLFSPDVIENRTQIENHYSDFRAIGDILVPHKLRRHLSGNFESEITLTTVRFNVGLADSSFQQ